MVDSQTLSPAVIASQAGTKIAQEVILGDYDHKDAVQSILVIFRTKDYSQVPSGIREIDRAETKWIDKARRDQALLDNQRDRAKYGRHRPERVDTGKPAFTLNRPIDLRDLREVMAKADFQFADIHRYKMDDNPEVEPLFVVVCGFVRGGDSSVLKPEEVAAFEELAGRTWTQCNAWDNEDPAKPITLNFKGVVQGQGIGHRFDMMNGALVALSIPKPEKPRKAPAAAPANAE